MGCEQGGWLGPAVQGCVIGLLLELDPDAYGSTEATTVMELVPAGVRNWAPPPQDMTPPAMAVRAADPISIQRIPRAPRIMRRRMQKSESPVRPPSHQGIELCAGEFGGLFTTTVSCVVAGGYGALGVLYSTGICPGEKTQIALAGNVEARHL